MISYLRSERFWFAGIFLVCLGIFLTNYFEYIYRFPSTEGDTGGLLNSTIHLFNCFKAAEPHCNNIAHFPIFQFVPAMIYSYLFDHTAFKLLVWISTLSYCGTFVLLWVLFGTRYLSIFLLGSIIMLTGPMLFYSKSSFGEMGAAFLTCLYVVCCIKRCSPLVIVLTFIAAGVTKEVAFPFLLLIGALCWGSNTTVKPWRHRSKYFYLTFAAGVVIFLTAAFNFYRFESLLNVSHLDPRNKVVFSQAIITATAIWFSPLVGLLIFWFSLSSLVFGSLYRQIWDLRNRRAAWLSFGRIKFALIVMMTLGLTWGFANWWSPFGWVAYGQRLILAWAPVILFLLLYYERDHLQKLLQSLTRKPLMFIAIAAAIILVALPHSIYFFHPDFPWRHFQSREFLNLVYEPKIALDYKVMNAMAFTGKPFLIYAYENIHPEWRVANRSYIAILVLCFYGIWRHWRFRTDVPSRTTRSV